MYLDKTIKPHLSAKKPLFEQMMLLRGEQFRNQEGRLTQRIILGGKPYFIKQYSGVGWKEILKNLFQLRWPILGAKHEKLALEKLKALGIAVPSVIAFGEKGLNPARLQSFVLTEALAPVISLEELCESWPTTPPTFSLKQSLLKEVAHIARTLHQNGMNHRDFYLCHFLLDLSPGLTHLNALNLKLYLIDLHRAQIRSATPLRWIIKDLAGLYFSSKQIGLTQRDLYRFIRFYTQQSLREIRNSNQTFWQKVKLRGERLYSEHNPSSS
jgi:heptose I phosphotransferase